MPFVIGVIGVGGPTEQYLPDQQRYKSVHQNIRDAMAAPAALPEFHGNVAAVLTENFWDQELTELRARDAKVKQAVKKLQTEGKLSREEQKAAQEKLRAEAFTQRELETLEKGVSNAEFHYLGCAKIMAQIGKGFAEAIKNMNPQ
jgi:alpha-galactosidase